MFVSLVLASQLLAGGFNLASATSKPALGQLPQDLSVLTNAQPSRTIWDMAATFTNCIASGAFKFPDCLRRFNEYPPDGGKLGFPRCLFENPFPLNPQFYLKGLDFSCVSPWNDSFGPLRAGTAISKRHIVFAKHYPIPVGTRISFVGVNGETSFYAVKASQALERCDIMIGLLDYELTPDIHPAKILPDGFEKWMPEGSKWPVVTFNKKEEAMLTEATSYRDKRTSEYDLDNNVLQEPTLKGFSTRLVSGDSGNPAFLIYHDKPGLIYCVTSAGCGSGARLHIRRAQVQSAMDALCPGYKLECLDLGE